MKKETGKYISNFAFLFIYFFTKVQYWGWIEQLIEQHFTIKMMMMADTKQSHCNAHLNADIFILVVYLNRFWFF